MSHQLAKGVHVARIEGDLVFLDARSNEYLCLAQRDAEAMALLPRSVRGAELVDELEDEGLIVPGLGYGLDLGENIVATATADCSDPTLVARFGLATILLAAAAAFWTAIELASTRAGTWFDRRARRREKGAGSLERAIATTTRFEAARPWLPRTGRCLPASMALLRFLRFHGIDADWVFAVRTYPFEAHCWVEKEGVVLNDTLDHVRSFTPIAHV